VSDHWQDLVDRNVARILASREARGYKPTPLPPSLSKTISEMPNLFLDAIYQKNTTI
jgi:hypothetical protein